MIIMKVKVSLLTTVIACVLVFLATYAIPKFALHKSKPETKDTVSAVDCLTNMEQIRVKRYEFVQPLLMANLMAESNKMHELRGELESYITELKSTQRVEEVTVYFRKMNNGEWFCINPNETYNPASMSKIIYILTYLKEAEYNTGVLNKKLYFGKHFTEGNKQNIQNFTLAENQYYTVKELMLYMIQYSDNDATLLLSQNMNTGIYNQIFNDLDLPPPPTAGEYFITAIDFSKFFRVLYNASFLNPEHSDFALKLLSQSQFKDGICAGVDPNIKVSHKFGERIIGNKAQMHEFGIVFYEGNPYMLGVMTKGTSLSELSEIIARISNITFNGFKKYQNS